MATNNIIIKSISITIIFYNQNSMQIYIKKATLQNDSIAFYQTYLRLWIIHHHLHHLLQGNQVQQVPNHKHVEVHNHYHRIRFHYHCLCQYHHLR